MNYCGMMVSQRKALAWFKIKKHITWDVLINDRDSHTYVMILHKYHIIQFWNVLQACVLLAAFTKAIALVRK